MENFSERLKLLRNKEGLTLVQLQEKTGISHTALNYWENGKREAKINALITLAKYFEVTTDYLLGLED